MMTTEVTRMTLEDRKELEFQIKELEKTLDACAYPGSQYAIIKELRRLRRLRA